MENGWMDKQVGHVSDSHRTIMRPIKITIEGDFWDTFLYRGYLYLWGMDNSVQVIDWVKLADHFAQKAKSRLLRIAIAEGEQLYGPTGLALLADKSISEQVHVQLRSFSESTWEISAGALSNFLICKQTSPFPELTDDLDFYFNHVYAATDRGVFVANADKNASRKTQISTKVSQISARRAYIKKSL
jgi:hypothetical protein